MALIAAGDLSGRRNLVRASQGKTGTGMIERRIRPHDGVVTLRAERSGETRRNVVRHSPAKRGRAVPRRLMAPITICVRGGERIVVANVAVRAGHDFTGGRILMRTRQRPAGCGVIKRDVRPQCRVMASGAVGRRKGRSSS